MRKFVVLTLLCLTISQTASFGWGRLGHEIVIAIAQRHLTETTKENIAKYMNYDLKQDAVWMDAHRHDEPIAYTTSWHVFAVDKYNRYDPNARIKTGDCIFSINLANYNLSHYQELTDSSVVMNIRMIIHWVGDMHCPVHTAYPGKRSWKCTLGDRQDSFHGFYDKMPMFLYGENANPDEIAAQLDNVGSCKRKKIAKGCPISWATECAERNAVIYEWNPVKTKVLDPGTVEMSRELVDTQLRNAGYRLAAMLNELFGEKVK